MFVNEMFLTLYMTVNWHREFAVNFATFLKVCRDFFTFAPWFSYSPIHNQRCRSFLQSDDFWCCCRWKTGNGRWAWPLIERRVQSTSRVVVNVKVCQKCSLQPETTCLRCFECVVIFFWSELVLCSNE